MQSTTLDFGKKVFYDFFFFFFFFIKINMPSMISF